MSWFKKNIGIILSILLITFTIAIFGPIEFYCTNSGEFWFSFETVLDIVLILASICIFTLLLIMIFLRGRGRDIFGVLLFSVGTALYIQGNFANINYGVLDGAEIDWTAYPVYAFFDTAGWLLLLGGGIYLYLRKKTWFETLQKYVSLYIIGIQIITLGYLLFTSDATIEKSEYYLSDEEMYVVSADENIIIFVLDAFDDAYFREIYNEDPDRYETIFCDFTYFNNAVAGAARTKAALPTIITGEAYPGTVSYTDYIKKSFNKDGLYSELKRQNYDVRFYTSSIFVPDKCADWIDNQESSGFQVSSYVGLTQKYFELTLYRYMPHILKKYFWLYTNEFEQFKIGTTAESYITDDSSFFNNMDLSVIENKNAFRLYHLNGAHGPYFLDEYAKLHSEKTDVIRQAKGALYIVENYIAQMKDLGIYDNATIIIMADHGDKNEDFQINNSAHAILLVKPSNALTGFTVSSAPISYFDLHATLFSEMGIDKGDSFFDIPEGLERERKFYEHFSEAGIFQVLEYSVEGNINDESSFRETGRVFAAAVKEQKYKYGDKLTFGANSSAVPFIVSGVSGTDAGSYAWTEEKECIFQFPLEKHPQSNLLVTIETVSVYTEKSAQTVAVYANDILCYETQISQPGEMQFVIDGSVVEEDNVLTLRLSLPDAVSPKELFGGADDPRILSLALSYLSIEETKMDPEQIQ